MGHSPSPRPSRCLPAPAPSAQRPAQAARHLVPPRARPAPRWLRRCRELRSIPGLGRLLLVLWLKRLRLREPLGGAFPLPEPESRVTAQPRALTSAPFPGRLAGADPTAPKVGPPSLRPAQQQQPSRGEAGTGESRCAPVPSPEVGAAEGTGQAGRPDGGDQVGTGAGGGRGAPLSPAALLGAEGQPWEPETGMGPSCSWSAHAWKLEGLLNFKSFTWVVASAFNGDGNSSFPEI